MRSRRSWNEGFEKSGFGVVKAGISRPAVNGPKWVVFELLLSINERNYLFAIENAH